MKSRTTPGNYEKGKRGFQPTLNQSQINGLLHVWIQNEWKNDPARRYLKESHRIVLPERTLSDNKKRLRDWYRKATNDLDQAADWADFISIAKHGIPHHHLGSLRRMWEETQRTCIEMGLMPLAPTYRTLKWWGYILEYYSDCVGHDADRVLIGDFYSTREFISEYFGTTMVREDLDMWLLYRPWMNPENMNTYKSLIDKKAIPSLNLEGYGSSETTFESGLRQDQFEQILHLIGLGTILALSPEPYLLPTQIFERYLPEILKNYEASKAPDKEGTNRY